MKPRIITKVAAVTLMVVMLGLNPRKSVVHSPILSYPAVRVIASRPKRKKIYAGDMRDFMRHMARIESGNDAHAVNRFGMLGKYQFSPHTIRALGIKTTKEEFLNNEKLQDLAMLQYMKDNYEELRPLVQHKIGTYHNGVLITKSGVIASAHLVGTTGVCAYFYPEKCSHRTKDGNGTTVAMYMKKFANYKVTF